MTAIAQNDAGARRPSERESASEPRRLSGLRDIDSIRRAGRPFDPAIAASALALNLLGLALPLAVLQIYDKMASAQAFETLSFLGAGLVVVALLECALRVVQSYSLAIDAQRLGYRVTTDAVERQLARGEAGAKRDSASITMEKFRALDTITNYASGDQRRDLIDLPFAAVYLAAIYVIGGWLVVVPCGVIVVSVLISRALLLRSRELTDKRDAGARRRADFLGEFFAGIMTVKGLGAEPLILRRFERLTAGSAKVYRDSFNAASNLQIATGSFGAVGTIFVVAVGAYFVIHGDLTAGGLAACSMLTSRAIQPLVRSVGAVAERHKALLAAESAKSLFEGERPPPEAFGHGVERRADVRTDPVELSAEGLCVTDNGRPVLDEASFHLPAGGVSLLEIQSSDSGRAFFRVLAGIEAPDAGEVLADGRNARQRRLSPGHAVVVTPRTRLFRGTIMENLTMFGAVADTQDALWAMRLLDASAMVGKLPAGYDTMVSLGAGESLSQTHLRLIVLARAIAQHPGMLLLDRPHLYLDAGAEERLYRALDHLRQNCTIVLRSDRPGALALADQRLQIRDGWFHAEKLERPAQRAAMQPKTAGGAQ